MFDVSLRLVLLLTISLTFVYVLYTVCPLVVDSADTGTSLVVNNPFKYLKMKNISPLTHLQYCMSE